MLHVLHTFSCCSGQSLPAWIFHISFISLQHLPTTFAMTRPIRLLRDLPIKTYGSLTRIQCFSNMTSLRRIAEEKVPVTTYDGGSERATIHVDQSQPSQVLATASHLSRKAERFDRGILPSLNHTMRKFTLDGKVAVITG